MERNIERQVGKYQIKGWNCYTDEEFFKVTVNGHGIYLSDLPIFGTMDLIEGDEKRVRRVLVTERLKAKRKVNKLNELIGE